MIALIWIGGFCQAYLDHLMAAKTLALTIERNRTFKLCALQSQTLRHPNRYYTNSFTSWYWILRYQILAEPNTEIPDTVPAEPDSAIQHTEEPDIGWTETGYWLNEKPDTSWTNMNTRDWEAGYRLDRILRYRRLSYWILRYWILRQTIMPVIATYIASKYIEFLNIICNMTPSILF